MCSDAHVYSKILQNLPFYASLEDVAPEQSLGKEPCKDHDMKR